MSVNLTPHEVDAELAALRRLYSADLDTAAALIVDSPDSATALKATLRGAVHSCQRRIAALDAVLAERRERRETTL